MITIFVIYEQHLLLAWTWAHVIRSNRHACHGDINTHADATLCNHFTISFFFCCFPFSFSAELIFTQHNTVAPRVFDVDPCAERIVFPERDYDLIPSERLFQVWVQLMSNDNSELIETGMNAGHLNGNKLRYYFTRAGACIVIAVTVSHARVDCITIYLSHDLWSARRDECFTFPIPLIQNNQFEWHDEWTKLFIP